MGKETEVKEEIRILIGEVSLVILGSNYVYEEVSAEEFYDYLTGETFTGDKTTLQDILENKYYVLHELIEISELKKKEIKINTMTVVNSPKELIYNAHFNAMDFELGYALKKKDYDWLKLRLTHHYKVLTDDPWIPEAMKPRAQALWDKYKEYQNGKK